MRDRGPPDERAPTDRLEFGVVVLDKPPGPTSHQVSAWVGDLTGVDDAGHVGTLDPAVSGCLPVLVDRATRLAGVLAGSTKTYVAVLEVHDRPPPDWRERLDGFEGELYQRPPRKSAVARRLRTRTVHDLTVLEREDRRILLHVSCEAGTYVRKLCHDVGLALGTGGHMAALRRTATGPFDDGDLVTLHDLADAMADWRENGDEAWLCSSVRPAEAALAAVPTVTISPGTAPAVATGAPVYAPGVIDVDDVLGPPDGQTVVCVTPDGAAVCLGQFVGDPSAASGTVVDLERVLV